MVADSARNLKILPDRKGVNGGPSQERPPRPSEAQCVLVAILYEAEPVPNLLEALVTGAETRVRIPLGPPPSLAQNLAQLPQFE